MSEEMEDNSLLAHLRSNCACHRADQTANEIESLRAQLTAALSSRERMKSALTDILDIVEATLARGDAAYGLGQIATKASRALQEDSAT